MTKAIFFDRDGTLNILKGYITSPDQIELVPQAAQVIRELKAAGYLLFVVTNQGIIARGVCTEAEVEMINQRLLELLEKEEAFVDEVQYCPHHATISSCACRKPAAGMLELLIDKYKIDRASSYMIGDFESDILAGKAAQVKTIKIGDDSEAEPDFIVKTLAEILPIILN